MGSAVEPTAVSVGLKMAEQLLSVSYYKEEQSAQHDTDKGDRSVLVL